MVRLIFESTERANSYSKLECYINQFNEIFIVIEHDDASTNYVCLDKSTAIKFSKVLRTEISKIQD